MSHECLVFNYTQARVCSSSSIPQLCLTQHACIRERATELYACQAGRAFPPPPGIPLDSEPCVPLFCLLADTSNNPHIYALSSLATEPATSEPLPEAFPGNTTECRFLTGSLSSWVHIILPPDFSFKPYLLYLMCFHSFMLLVSVGGVVENNKMPGD